MSPRRSCCPAQATEAAGAPDRWYAEARSAQWKTLWACLRFGLAPGGCTGSARGDGTGRRARIVEGRGQPARSHGVWREHARWIYRLARADKNSYAHARRPGDSTNSITAGSKSSPPGMALRATRERPLPGPPVRDGPNVPTRMAVAVASWRSLATSDARPDGCADDRHDTGARSCWVGCQEIAGVPDRDSRYHVGGRVRRNRNRDRIACHAGRRDEPSPGCPRLWWGQRLPCQRDAWRLHRRWFPSGCAPSRRRCARNAPVTSGG
jgi:hypothetical protein